MNIRGKEPSLGFFFMKHTVGNGLFSGVYQPTSFKLGMMIDSTEF